MKLDELDSLIRCYTTVKNIVGGGYVSRVIKN